MAPKRKRVQTYPSDQKKIKLDTGGVSFIDPQPSKWISLDTMYIRNTPGSSTKIAAFDMV